MWGEKNEKAEKSLLQHKKWFYILPIILVLHLSDNFTNALGSSAFDTSGAGAEKQNADTWEYSLIESLGIEAKLPCLLVSNVCSDTDLLSFDQTFLAIVMPPTAHVTEPEIYLIQVIRVCRSSIAEKKSSPSHNMYNRVDFLCVLILIISTKDEKNLCLYFRHFNSVRKLDSLA